ncbi:MULTISPECIES: V-type ATP synthase subunit I [unclassified Ruminococcus]|uniref:V-type ATP synthase subunit I n=1 Tax=unclassified Ruminococcus TaxID=2608920 RepID=UPI00210BD155|nr:MULTISPECIES: V-type ATPase 116kDa subunit family protein [unclassified Ruminococcus]MCQ4022879.1 ATPase [Ruminococcus sp. zg-924]MCQ4115305.1 ATPase [Ruminococcus sp. zg-921]
MAVSPIKSIGIIGLRSELEKVIDICGSSGQFQPDDPLNFYSDTRGFMPVTDKNPYTDPLSEFTETLSFAGIEPDIVDVSDVLDSNEQVLDRIEAMSHELERLIADKAELNQRIDQCKRSIEEASHFVGMDMDFDKIFSCEFIKANFGRLPHDSYKKLENYRDDPYISFFICTEDETHYWGVYVTPIDKREDIDRIFSGLYFEHCDIDGFHGTPEQSMKILGSHLDALLKDLDVAQSKLDSYYKYNKTDINRYFSKISELELYSSIKKNAMYYHKSFILVGWVPSSCADELVSKLESIDSIECSLTDGKDELKHSPPIKLKNNLLSKPYEYFVDMYGLPCYNEPDPTFFVSLTFTILFGIMFGDVGQGIVLIIAGYLMWKLKKMDIGKILMPCGVSATLFGFVYGSVFGFEDVLDPLYHAIGLSGKPVPVLESATMLVVVAAGIGVFLVLVAMLLNVYSSLKRRDFGRAIFHPSGICGIIFYASLVAGLLCTLFGIPVMNIWYVLFLIVVPLIFIYLNEMFTKLVNGEKNWKPEKWGEYLVQSFFELFETLLSYVTNTMSYLRIGTFALVHAGMMLVFFTLAGLLGEPGSIPYIIMVVFGNAFVIVLEATLVTIQVLRLEYYELFSRYYIGGGRAFNPVRLNKK